jgi:hypothetical protein
MNSVEGASTRMMIMFLSRASDEDKITALEKICEHFDVDSAKIIKKIRKNNDISTHSKFLEKMNTDGYDSALKEGEEKKINGKMW